MACCAKTNYQCAGLRAPDDCCQHMGHTAIRAAAGTLTSVELPVLTAAAIDRGYEPDLAARGAMTVGCGWKRPHDPPHLHQYNPLI
jgi:hypothetical protein